MNSTDYVDHIKQTYELGDILHEHQNFYECLECEITNTIDHLENSQEDLIDRLSALKVIIKQKQENY